jgi:hypothetical protein
MINEMNEFVCPARVVKLELGPATTKFTGNRGDVFLANFHLGRDWMFHQQSAVGPQNAV